jgi:hypothetical protein
VDRLFQICAAIGGTLIVCQFLLSLIGIGGENDHDGGGAHDGGQDAGHDHHDAHDHHSSWIFGKLTLRTIAAALAFFGLTGMAARKAELDDTFVLLLAVGAGLGAFYFVSWILHLLSRLNIDGTVRIEKSLDQSGKVHVAIPGAMAGAGKVHVEVLGRTLEYRAQTAGRPLATGTPIRVVAIISSDTVEVLPLIEREAQS